MSWRLPLFCSFCHRPDSKVEKLVAGPRILFVGPRVYICDACATKSVTVMYGGSTPPEASGTRACEA